MSSTGQIVGGIVGGVIGFYVGGPAGAFRGAVIGAGIGGYIDPPPGPNLRGPTLDDTSYQSTAYGVGIPRLWGTVAISGNIIWLENDKYRAVSNKKKSGGKGGGGATVTTTTYFATFAVALCEAVPGALVRRIWAGGKLIYSMANADFNSQAQSAKNFNFTFYDGSQTEPDSRMEAVLGVGNCPSYQGTAYIIFRDFDLTDYGNGLQGCPMKIELVCGAESSDVLVNDYFRYRVVESTNSGSGFGTPKHYSNQNFDDSAWAYARGNFGTARAGISVNTPVSPSLGRSIWLRKKIRIPGFYENLTVRVFHDDGARLWVNNRVYTINPVAGYTTDIVISRSVLSDFISIALQIRDGVPSGNPTGILAGLVFFTDTSVPVFEVTSIDIARANLVDIVQQQLNICGISGADLTALAGDTVDGYNTVGLTSARAALAQLQAVYMFDLVERGYQLVAVKRGANPVANVPRNHFILSDPLVSAEREQDSQLPSRYAIKYMDFNREYDVSEQYADYPSYFENQREENFAVVMSASRAAQLADILINLAWVERDRYSFTLPQTYLDLQESQTILAEVSPGYSRLLRISSVEKSDAQTVMVRARAADNSAYFSNAVGADVPPPVDTIPFIGDATAYLLDAPMLLDNEQDMFGFVAAMHGDGATWPGGVLLESADSGQTFNPLLAFYGQGTVGQAVNVLPANNGFVIDRVNSLSVNLMSGDLESITEPQMMTGRHYCAYGVHGRWEILQFADAVQNLDGSITLRTFVRGVRGTEWATGLHQVGDYFVLLDDADNAFVSVQAAALLVNRQYKAVTIGDDATAIDAFDFDYRGVNLAPLSPVRPAAEFTLDADWQVNFVGRTRYSSTFWLTGLQPQNEPVIEYRMDIKNGGNVVRTLSSANENFTYTLEQQREDFNGFATANLQAEIYQMSQRVGRGYPVLLSANTGVEPLAPSPARVVSELPYYFWVNIYGQAATDIALGIAPTAGRLMLAAAAPNAYAENAEFIADGVSLGVRSLSDVRLLTNVNRVENSWTVSGNFSVPVIAQVGNELVQITALAGGVATVTRAVLDTIPEEHFADDYIVLLSDLVVRDFINSANDSATAKILPRSIFGELPDAVADTMEFNSRAIRPYPSANIKFNGVYWPDEIDSPVTVTFSHRNRLQQTGGDQIGFYDAGVTPEVGNTTSVEFFEEFGTVPVHTETGIAGTSSTPWSTEGRHRIEVFSVRDGYESTRVVHIALIGAQPWTPANLLNQPKIWLDEDSLITESAGLCAQWNDKSTNAWHFSQANSGNMPTVLNSELNGKRVIRFDGNNDFMQSNTARTIFTNVGVGWIFCIVKKRVTDASGTTRYFFNVNGGNNITRFNLRVGDDSGANRKTVGVRRLDADSGATLLGSSSSGVWDILRVEMRWTSGSCDIFLNGQLDATSSSLSSSGNTQNTTAAHANAAPTIGANRTTGSAGSFSDVDVALMIVGNNVITASEAMRMDGWSAHKFGLQSSLPTDHQYRYTPPYVNTPNLQNNFAALPAVFAFNSATSGGNTGAAKNTGSDYGTLLSPAPTLSVGQMIRAYSNGGNITVRLDAITLSPSSVNAVVLDYKGNILHTIPLTNHTTYWEGSVGGNLDAGEVYYVRIESA